MREGAASNPLAGTKWQMQDYTDPAITTGMTSVGQDTIMTIEFGEDDQVSGSGDCNDYQGTYTADGDSLTFGPLATTMMECSEPVSFGGVERYNKKEGGLTHVCTRPG